MRLLRARVNAAYGYNAIARLRITQTAPTGFAEGQAQFAPEPKREATPDPEVRKEAAEVAAPVGDRHAALVGRIDLDGYVLACRGTRWRRDRLDHGLGKVVIQHHGDRGLVFSGVTCGVCSDGANVDRLRAQVRQLESLRD